MKKNFETKILGNFFFFLNCEKKILGKKFKKKYWKKNYVKKILEK